MTFWQDHSGYISLAICLPLPCKHGGTGAREIKVGLLRLALGNASKESVRTSRLRGLGKAERAGQSRLSCQ